MNILFYQKYNFQFIVPPEVQEEMCGVVFVLSFFFPLFFSIKLKTLPVVWKSALLALELLVLVPS